MQNTIPAHLAWLREPRSTPLSTAHRSASDYGFDNSLQAFERAALIGADLFEVDVRTTADGVLVAWHDPSVRQLGGEPHPVSSLSLQQLQEIAKDANAVQQSGRHLSAFGIECGVIASYNTTSIRALRDQGTNHALSILVPASGNPIALAEQSGADIVHLCWASARTSQSCWATSTSSRQVGNRTPCAPVVLDRLRQ